MKNEVLKISNQFSFGYSDNLLFSLQGKNTDLVFEQGKIYGIFGNNGSGKTTFLNILNSFLSPSSGKIFYHFPNGKYINEGGIEQKFNYQLISNNIRRCFQTPFLIDELSIYKNIVLAKRLYNKETFNNTFSFSNKELKLDEINELLEFVGLKGDELAENLSYGQRRIISNFRVIYSNAQLILLDEPFSNLHVEVIEKLKDEYLKKVNEHNSTIVIIEHLPENLKNFANEIIFIKNKKIIKQVQSVGN